MNPQLWTQWTIATITVIFVECCFCIRIINQPKIQINVNEHESTELDCIFDRPARCAWLRNDRHVKIGGRYRFKDPKRLNVSDDCSIVINDVKSYDKGHWRCSNTADSTGDPIIISLDFTLNIEETKIVVQPQNKIVKRGSTVNLNCQFNKKVKCMWNRNDDMSMSPGDDYEFVYYQNNDRHTKNCSITFANANKLDHQGNWTCNGIVGDVTTKTVISSMAKIEVEDPIIVMQPPIQINASLNEGLILTCKLDIAVNCQWLLNGTMINDNLIQYRISNGTSTEDCSIIIDEFNESYVGLWTCVDGQDHAIASRDAFLALESRLKAVSECAVCNDSSTGYIVIAVTLFIVVLFAILNQKYKWLSRLSKFFQRDSSVGSSEEEHLNRPDKQSGDQSDPETTS